MDPHASLMGDRRECRYFGTCVDRAALRRLRQGKGSGRNLAQRLPTDSARLLPSKRRGRFCRRGQVCQSASRRSRRTPTLRIRRSITCASSWQRIPLPGGAMAANDSPFAAVPVGTKKAAISRSNTSERSCRAWRDSTSSPASATPLLAETTASRILELAPVLLSLRNSSCRHGFSKTLIGRVLASAS